MTREQELIIRASDLYVDAANAFAELYELMRHEIRTPFHPAQEIAEIYVHELKGAFESLADMHCLDITVKTTFRLRRPNLTINP